MPRAFCVKNERRSIHITSWQVPPLSLQSVHGGVLWGVRYGDNVNVYVGKWRHLCYPWARLKKLVSLQLL